MSRMLMKEAEEAVRKTSDYVNKFDRNNSEFIDFMTKEHRTIQQNFTKLCFDWLVYCAHDDYPRDGRNEASHERCKEIVELIKEQNPYWRDLPLV